MTLLTPTPTRRIAYDVLRGLAIVAMIIDHLALFTPHGEPLRYTIGRLAMPLFFVLAGVFATKWRRKYAIIALWGIALPLYVPWIDDPNVLFYLAIFTPLTALMNTRAAIFVVVAIITIYANFGIIDVIGSGYPPLALLALIAIGRLIRTTGSLAIADRAATIPGARHLAFCGRHALTIYVGHVLLLQTVALTATLLT